MAEAHQDLLELVRTEQLLDEELAAARAEAAHIVEQARGAASARINALDQEAARAVAELSREAETALAARLDELDSAASIEARRYQALDETVVGELARRMVARLVDAPGTAS